MKGGRFVHQIADLAQEGLVGGRIVRDAGAGLMPGVDLGLQVLALGQQGLVQRCVAAEHLGHARPEPAGVHAQGRQDIGLHEAGQHIGDLQAGAIDIVGHGNSLQRPRR